MADYKLLIKPSAGKELEKVGVKADRVRIVERIHGLSSNPRPHGAEKLVGQDNRYRVRQGSYRIVYSIDDSAKEITIFKIGDRKEIYR